MGSLETLPTRKVPKRNWSTYDGELLADRWLDVLGRLRRDRGLLSDLRTLRSRL